jgi:predicted sulfurtransferase
VRRNFSIGVVVISLFAVSLMAQEPTIRRPENLPEPVNQDQRIDVAEIDNTLADSNVVLLDVREAWELEKYGTRDGYIHIPLFELEGRLDELPRDKMILTA